MVPVQSLRDQNLVHTLQITSALIIDLRANRGGDPEVGLVLMGYLFDKPVHLGDFLSKSV
jgi:C-terminal processing protease CtpA/Prc